VRSGRDREHRRDREQRSRGCAGCAAHGRPWQAALPDGADEEEEPVAVLLALTAAASWGASDFFGGLAGRRAPGDVSVSVSLAAHVIGAVGLSLVALLVGADAVTGRDVAFSMAAGVGGAAGVALLYRGLAIGKMGIVAPITGAGAAALPVVVGVATGGRPTALAWLGVLLAMISIVLVSREPEPVAAPEDAPLDRGLRTPGVREAIGAGLGFGLIFVMLDRTAEAAGLWPLIPMKLTSVVLLAAFGLLAGRELAAPRIVWPLVLTVGVLDNAANVAYLLATRRGLLALVAVVSSLYPVVTVVLARFVLEERLARHQIGGLALAGVAVALISAG
jgi:drug/metabolite transporter (DMT)-like permease